MLPLQTEPLYQQDAYLQESEATVLSVNERGGIVVDSSVFYPTGGGQPGDKGQLRRTNGEIVDIATTVYGDGRQQIVLVPAAAEDLPGSGEIVTLALDWETRFSHMRVHTALHLLCSIVPFPVTGGQISAGSGRLDFDIDQPDAVDKDSLAEKINQLISENQPVSERWIADEELDSNPGLVRTMSVQPPRGTGRVRLVAIGEQGSVDLQPCGGTHVRSTGEIGAVSIDKIEKKGKQNRRIRLSLA